MFVCCSHAILFRLKSSPSLISNVQFESQNILVLDFWVFFPSLCLLTVTFCPCACVCYFFSHSSENKHEYTGAQKSKHPQDKIKRPHSMTNAQWHVLSVKCVHLKGSFAWFTTAFLLLSRCRCQVTQRPSHTPATLRAARCCSTTGSLRQRWGAWSARPPPPPSPLSRAWATRWTSQCPTTPSPTSPRPPWSKPSARRWPSWPRSRQTCLSSRSRAPSSGQEVHLRFFYRRDCRRPAHHTKTELRGLYRYCMCSPLWVEPEIVILVEFHSILVFLAKQTCCMSSISVSFTVGCL